jgi:hypothetical protein
METDAVAPILTPELEQNFHHKRGFILPQVHLQGQKNILMNA